MTMESRRAVQIIACVILILSEAFEKCKSDQLGKQPHIIFILVDDLGWDDVSFHGSSQIPTPNIDSLARDGVILTNYYVSPVCTPTRSAIMTGKHPIHTGMQGVISADEPWGLGLEETTIAQHLKSLGYSTHAVGKWHLGFFAEEYTPTRRGFDSFLGFYSGRGDYFTHEEATDDFIGYDFRKNLKPHKTAFGQYSTDIFTEEAKMIIETHNASQPLFLYLAHQAVHAAVYKGLTQEAPYEYYKRFPHIKTKGRRLYAAMASALDDSVGIISQTLRDAGLYDNTIIIFSTDNGGPTSGTGQGDHACNYPLRGGKFTLWEGGVRGTAFVNSPLIKKQKRINDHLMHVCDWLPTLYRVGGGDPESLTGLDGFDQWDSLSRNAPSPRKEVLHNIDPFFGTSAIRIGDYKLIYGPMAKRLSGWYRPEGEPSNEPVPNSFAVKCPSKPLNASTNCDFTHDNTPCLYNIRDDPCEFNNIADWNQDIVDRMSARLEKYHKSAVEPRNQPADPQSDPRLHGNVWQPWITLSQDNTSSHKDNTRTQVHQP